jgi:hypothetical protein
MPAPIGQRSFISVVSDTFQPVPDRAQALAVGMRRSVKYTSLKSGLAVDLLDRADLDAGALHVDEEHGQAVVLGDIGSVRVSRMPKSE